MHILEIPSFFVPHGGLFCLDQARALQARGHEVRILSCVELCITTDGLFYYTAPIGRWWETMQGIEVYRTYQRRIPRNFRLTLKRNAQILNSMFEEYVKKYGRPDVIHAHCGQFAGMAVRLISQRTDIPYFITEHLSAGIYTPVFGDQWERHTWIRDEIRKSFESAACVFPVSKELFDNISTFFGRNYKHQVIGNMIDTQFFAYVDRKKEEGKKFRFVCLANAGGKFLKLKGLDLLSKVWKDFEDCELSIAGLETDSEEMHRLFDPYPNVRLWGCVDKNGVRDLLYQSDALVLPTTSEAQPLVLLEAMATGIPVVTTEAVPSSVRIEGAGLIAPIGDEELFARQMRSVMEIAPSPAISAAVEAVASPTVIASQLEEAFCSVL